MRPPTELYCWFTSILIHLITFAACYHVSLVTPGDDHATLLNMKFVPPEHRMVVEPPPPPAVRAPPMRAGTPAVSPASPRVAIVSRLPLIATAAPARASHWVLPLPVGPASMAGPQESRREISGGRGGSPAGATNGVAGAEAAAPLSLPRYDHAPLPEYPSLAKARRWEGVALLRVEVLADGHTGHVELLSSSGYRSLDESAVKAVSSWRFAPATRGGTSVPCAIQVPVRFKLNNAGD